MLSRENLLTELADLAGRTTELRQAVERNDLPPLVAARVALEVSKAASKLGRLASDARRACKAAETSLPGVG